MNDETEIWKDCVGFEGRYQVSDQGRVRSLDTMELFNGRWGPTLRSRKGKVLSPQTINSGYESVHLYSEGVRHVRLVHRLVGEAFCTNPLGLPEINHDDTDKSNNRADNLVWSTRLDNVAHAILCGLVTEKPNAMPVIGVSMKDGSCVNFPSMKDAEIALSGKQSSAINHCFSGVKKSAYGYTWSRG